jgi:hypothetical protein
METMSGQINSVAALPFRSAFDFHKLGGRGVKQENPASAASFRPYPITVLTNRKSESKAMLSKGGDNYCNLLV